MDSVRSNGTINGNSARRECCAHFDYNCGSVLLLQGLAPLHLSLSPTMTILFVQVKFRAPLNHVVQSTSDEDNLPDITEEQTTLLINDDGESDESDANPNICSKCHKYTPPRTFHCTICQACIVKRDHHNIWLDACIGESNHRLFFFGSIFSIMALTLGTNLALTSICHPFAVGRVFGIPIFLPDDCSEVFDQFECVNTFV